MVQEQSKKQSLVELLVGRTQSDKILAANDSNKFFGKALAVLLAIGLSDEQITRILEVEQVKVDQAKFNTNIIETSLMIQTALGYSPEQKIAAAVGQALEAKIRIMLETQDDKLKNAIATDLIERHMGKPVQMSQTVNVNVSANVSQKDLDSKIKATAERVRILEQKKALLLGARGLDKDQAIPSTRVAEAGPVELPAVEVKAEVKVEASSELSMEPQVSPKEKQLAKGILCKLN